MFYVICTVCLKYQCIEGMVVLGRFLVAPSSYTKLVKAVYRQRMYLYLVQFSGMLHCWLHRYYTRIRTLGSSLVVSVISNVFINIHEYDI